MHPRADTAILLTNDVSGRGVRGDRLPGAGSRKPRPDAMERWRAPRAVHDPGKIVADPAAALALGGDCLADIAMLREEPELAGPVASDPVVLRLVTALAADEKRR